MSMSHVGEVIQLLRSALVLQDGTRLTDEELLEDYVNHRNEAALAALVQRHAPIVWGVCRRLLRSYHDAEDSFQATFLVLVRNVGSITSRDLLANWLYRFAYQTASNARAAAARRHAKEKQIAELPEPAVVEQDLWSELRPLLDQEICRLPDTYRGLILLCDLEGKTRTEAAL
jgi:RNA polymerase sigma factor (sigma-70 family)